MGRLYYFLLVRSSTKLLFPVCIHDYPHAPQALIAAVAQSCQASNARRTYHVILTCYSYR
jgi:hypothetical protein